MITFEKETGRIVKWLDRPDGVGSIWNGLRSVQFVDGTNVPAKDVGTLVTCARRPPGAKPMFHHDSCPYPHREMPNPESSQ